MKKFAEGMWMFSVAALAFAIASAVHGVMHNNLFGAGLSSVAIGISAGAVRRWSQP